MKLDHPRLLYILWALIAFPFIEWAVIHRRDKLKSKFGRPQLVDSYSKFATLRNRVVMLVLFAALFAELSFALAGPSTSANAGSGTVKFFPHLALIDVSRSMDVADYANKTRRIEMVQKELLRLYETYLSAVAGIASFASEPFVQGDITTDIGALKFIAKNWVRVGSAPGTGSNVAAGLKMAIDTLSDYNKSHTTEVKTILLFSDSGGVTSLELDKQIQRLSENGLTLVVVGVGSDSGGPVPLRDGDGKIIGYFAKGGAPIISVLDESSLKNLASRSHGQYVRLKATGSTLSAANARLAVKKIPSFERKSLVGSVVLIAIFTLLIFLIVSFYLP